MQWLPALITFAEYDGDWDRYLDAIYAKFREDFCNGPLEFICREVRLKKHPVAYNKEATFWHFVSQGKEENDRDIDFRRAERIAWPLAFMNNANDPSMRIWTEVRNNRSNIHIWNEQASYLVVLSDRVNYILPWTAYPVDYDHQKQKLNRRWQQYKEP
jgi:hypothetical protein